MDNKGIADALRARIVDDDAPISDATIEDEICDACGVPRGSRMGAGLRHYVKTIREAERDAKRRARVSQAALRGLAIRKGSGVLSCALCNSVWRPHEGERHDDDCAAKP